MPCSACCGRRCSGGWRDTRMSTTPSDCAMTPRCDGSSAGRRLWLCSLAELKWAASKRGGSRPKEIFRRLPISPANGLTRFMAAVRREASYSTSISSVSPTYGEQELSVWNGHYECTCYHPLFVFNQFGDLERCALRPGNVHSADGRGGLVKAGGFRLCGQVARHQFRGEGGLGHSGGYGKSENGGESTRDWVASESCRAVSDP